MFLNIFKKFRKINIVTISILLMVVFVGQNFIPEKANAVAGVSNYLSYQGRLTDTSGNPLGGAGTNYCFSFSIFDASSGGTKVWPTGATTTTILNVVNGVFNASVGDVSTVNFSTNDTLYFNVNVAAQVGGVCTGVVWEELSPRQKVDSVVYARTAHDLYGGDAQIGTATGVASGQNLLKLDVRSVAETVGGTCATAGYPNGAMWYNSGNGKTLLCNNNVIQAVGFSNPFFDFTGPTASRTFTLPDVNATILTSASVVTIAQGGTGTTTAQAAFDALNPLTTKGDILSDTGTTSIRLSVGTNGQTLTASSTAASGLAWATASGGGGSPGGSDTQIQFNNAGAFGGGAGLTWVNSTNDLFLGGADTGITLTGITNEPASPSAGNLHIYSKSIAGRMLPKWKAPSGVDTSFQSSLGFNRIATVAPAGGAVLASAVGAYGTAFTNIGTVANPIPTATNALTSTRRTTFSTGAVANTITSHRQQTLMVWRGNNVTNAPGGFFFSVRFGLSVLAVGNRAFIGLADVITAPTNVDPTTSTAPGKIGLAINLNTGNWKFVHNVTGTAPAVTDLGASFPVNATDLYELVLFSKPNDTVINYRVTNITTGAQVTGATLATNIPTATTFLAPLMWLVNVAATNAAIDLGGWYLESDQ